MSCIHGQKTKIYSVFFLIYFSIASNKVNKRVVFYDCKYTNWRYKKIVQDKMKTMDKVPLLFDKENFIKSFKIWLAHFHVLIEKFQSVLKMISCFFVVAKFFVKFAQLKMCFCKSIINS